MPRMIVTIDDCDEELEYETYQGLDDPSVGYRAPIRFDVDAADLTPSQLADVLRHIEWGHVE